MGIFSKLEQTLSSKKDGDRYLSGLDKPKESFSERTRKLALGFTGVSEESLEDLMVALLEADIGIKATQKIVNGVENRTMDQKLKSPDEISECLIEVMHELHTSTEDEDFHKDENGPTVVLMVSVNGNGKTTTMAKPIELFQSGGSDVVLAAADTFRIGMIDQPAKWADRPGMTCIKGREGGDPGAALAGACHYAKEHGMDHPIEDTAGRLQNRAGPIQELGKTYRAIEREIPGAPHEVRLVLDTMTGQNGISQAQIFLETAKASDTTLTKMDSTAEGGIVIVIRDLLGLPVKYIKLGKEGDNLRPFDIDSYLYGLCEDISQRD